MCNISSFIENRAKVDDARNIMEKLSYTIEQTLDLLEIKEDDRPYFIDQLKDDNV